MDKIEDVKRILSKNEEIKFTYKPNLVRFGVINTIFAGLIPLIVGGALLGFGLGGLTGIIKFMNEDGTPDTSAPLAITLFLTIAS